VKNFRFNLFTVVLKVSELSPQSPNAKNDHQVSAGVADPRAAVLVVDIVQVVVDSVDVDVVVAVEAVAVVLADVAEVVDDNKVVVGSRVVVAKNAVASSTTTGQRVGQEDFVAVL
jgi:hypothetical protein